MLKQDPWFVILVNTVKNLPILIILLIVLGLSIYTAYEIKSVQNPAAGQGQGTIELLKSRLDSHAELKKYSAQYPRVTYLTDVSLKQADDSNLTFFKDADPGDYLLEYAEAAAIYRPKDDKIVNIREIEMAPADLLDKLAADPQLAAYKGIRPAAVIKVSQDNLENLKQQINGLDETFIGNYIISYSDRIVIYNYEAGQIVSNIALQAPAQQNLPNDFFTKLLAHPGMEGYGAENPNGRQLDQQALDQLKQAYPTLYKNAEPGDFVLQYSDKMIIYNYENDQIKDTFSGQ